MQFHNNVSVIIPSRKSGAFSRAAAHWEYWLHHHLQNLELFPWAFSTQAVDDIFSYLSHSNCASLFKITSKRLPALCFFKWKHTKVIRQYLEAVKEINRVRILVEQYLAALDSCWFYYLGWGASRCLTYLPIDLLHEVDLSEWRRLLLTQFWEALGK